jgi:trans-2,3-dihydro-3-hydroxyanthranilate isomerase
MAGHPTIGTAWTILKHGLLKPRNENHLVFDEGVGPVRVDFTMTETARPADLVMHQPLPHFGETLDKTKIAQLLSLQSSDIDEECPVQIVSCGVPIIVVPLRSLDAARSASVRLDLMDANLAGIDCRELLVFTQESEKPDADVHCRFFAPRFGVAEDPATGGAHGPLGSYLVKYGISDGRRIFSEQGIEMGRPSEIKVHIESVGTEITAVLVGGECVEVGGGTIHIDRTEDQER